MSKIKVLKETPLSLTETKGVINRLKERDAELNFRAKKVEEFLNVFAYLDEKSAKELKDKLESLKLPRLKEQHIAKLVDVLPVTVEEFKTLMTGWNITISNDAIKKIIDAILPYREKKKK